MKMGNYNEWGFSGYISFNTDLTFQLLIFYILKIVKLTRIRERPSNWIRTDIDEPTAYSPTPGPLLDSVLEPRVR